MCWLLYVAADRPLPTLPWREDAPGFNAVELPSWEVAARAHLTKPYAYLVGSQTRCACGFDREQSEGDETERRATESALAMLRGYLAHAVTVAGAIELYTCWDGQQDQAPEYELELTPEHFGPTMTWFAGRTRVTLTASVPQPA